LPSLPPFLLLPLLAACCLSGRNAAITAVAIAAIIALAVVVLVTVAVAVSAAISSSAAFGWLLSVTPAITIAADVFVVAAATTATATNATAVAVIIARRYCRWSYCRHCHHGQFLQDGLDTDATLSA
jgi:hypothetical protein